MEEHIIQVLCDYCGGYQRKTQSHPEVKNLIAFMVKVDDKTERHFCVKCLIKALEGGLKAAKESGE